MRLAALGTAAVLALIAGAGFMEGVAAGAAAPAVDRQAWAPSMPGADAAAQPGHLYVGAAFGQEGSRAFVHVDLGADAASVQGLGLVLTEGADSQLADRAALAACLLTQPFPASGELAAGQAPQADCTVRTDGVRSADGHWRFDLGVFLDAWRTRGDYGLAVLPSAPLATAAYRVSFDAAQTRADAVMAPAASPSTTEAPAAPAGGSGTVAVPDVDPFPAPGPVAAGEPPTATPPAGPAPAAVAPSPAGPTRYPSSDSPRTAPALGALLIVAVIVIGGAALARPALIRSSFPAIVLAPGRSERAMSAAVKLALALAFVLLPSGLSENTVYKLGLVLIFVVGALGLHVLVNWAGELSLAHAGVVGVPAFVVAQLSSTHHISPIALLPVAVVVGAVVGGLVALPALRTRGLYVAVVTLASGVAIDRFFFTRTWVVGHGSVRVATPSLGFARFDSSAELYPVLAVTVLVAVAAVRALHGSKMARAFAWSKCHPEAAAAGGVPVAGYRLLAYAVAGALAGLAGGLYPMWLSLVTAGAFPLSLSFTYLIVVVLAGAGSVGGVIAAAAVLQGGALFASGAGALFDYGGPLGLVLVLTRSPEGLNGIGRSVMRSLRARLARRALARRAVQEGAGPAVPGPPPWSLSLICGALAVVLGFGAIALAWYHAGNTDRVFVQVQEALSGGVGGLSLVVLGAGLIVRDALLRRPAANAPGAAAPALRPFAEQEAPSENGHTLTPRASRAARAAR